MPDETALDNLIDEIRRRPEERALMDAPTFWARLGMAGADPGERRTLATELQRRHLSLSEDARRTAVYLVWMGRSLPTVAKVRRQKHEEDKRAAEEHRRGQRQRREMARSATMPPPDLRAPFVRALSIRQPYAELILQGHKVEEFRTWLTAPGPLLIHASRTMMAQERQVAKANTIDLGDLTYGALLGVVDVVQINGEPGDYAWLLARPRRFAVPLAYKGAVGILKVPMPLVEKALREVLEHPDQ